MSDTTEQIATPTMELAERRAKVFDFLAEHQIEYTTYDHPEAPTIEIARQYWHADGSKHCKNLFFRNHKGNRHYLVVFDSEREMAIRDLEQRLRQGKLSFASDSVWSVISVLDQVRYRHLD